MQDKIETTRELVEKAFETQRQKIAAVRKRLNRPLTLAEKILFGHLDNPEAQVLNPGESILALRPDRVAMQDATAQMALLQFLSTGKSQTAVPSTVHCDHLIQAHRGSAADMKTALDENKEVYDFLKAASSRCGIGFWGPGAGIIHQVVLENYAFPGGLMIGTDSHTPNAGGLGMIAVGVGGADAVDAMAGFPWEVKYPKLIGVHLKGELKGWSAPKDVISYLCGVLTTKGGTNRIVEYFGEGVKSISCTGKATITNMGAELGATSSVFPWDERMATYLKSTDRDFLVELCEKNSDLLKADAEIEENPALYFEKIIEIDLSQLEPQIVGPHTPDLSHTVSTIKEDVKKNQWPEKLTAALIGSCTNSSYEDISRAVDVARQAQKAGLKMQIPFLVSPGSDQIYETMKRDGQLEVLESVGATVLSNACGPCIGQWKRDDVKKGEKNSIINSFNRNFPARNDGNPETLSFIGSPEIVMAYGLKGSLAFNPLQDTLTTPDKKEVKLNAPEKAPEVPSRGFVKSRKGYFAPDAALSKVEIDKTSKRLQLLEPFKAWDGKDFVKLPLLAKIKGKCTTDHISPAGPWLKFRGHLNNISDNMFLGAVNAFSGEAGKTENQFTQEVATIPAVARDYKTRGAQWVVVGDENYGEGSSREHAAMSPRFLNGAVIIAKSFARIHETNLKKQGLLPLVFVNPSDYDKVRETDSISVLNLKDFKPGQNVTAVLNHADGSQESIELKHSFTDEQIKWFKAGSALNLIRQK